MTHQAIIVPGQPALEWQQLKWRKVGLFEVEALGLHDGPDVGFMVGDDGCKNYRILA